MLSRRQDQVRDRVLEHARADTRITGAALTGSAAAGRDDRWSDVDLFLGATDVAAVLADLTAFLYDELAALHHFELVTGAAVYRAFLLEDGFEVDLGVAPAAEFRAHGDAAFRVVFGEPAAPSPPHRLDVSHLAGLLWHHVRHARTAIERGRPWSAEYWISQARYQVVTLAAERHGLDTGYAKGADTLPGSVRESLAAALVRELDATGLNRALRAVTAAALAELRRHDEPTADRLAEPLRRLADPSA